MRLGSFILATLLAASAGNGAAFAYCEGGQQPVPPAVAAQMALPACGFAATKRWGPNGCQLCDSRNMYPNPFTGNDAASAGRHVHYRQPANTW